MTIINAAVFVNENMMGDGNAPLRTRRYWEVSPCFYFYGVINLTVGRYGNITARFNKPTKRRFTLVAGHRPESVQGR